MKKLLVLLLAVSIFIFMGGLASADINQSLVAHYKLDGNLSDSSGYGNDGIVYQGEVTYEAGMVEQAARFDGNTFVWIYDYYFPVGTGTISMWVRVDCDADMTNPYHLVMDSETNYRSTFQYGLDSNENETFYIGNGSAPAQRGVWKLYTYVYKNGTSSNGIRTTYVDGVFNGISYGYSNNAEIPWYCGGRHNRNGSTIGIHVCEYDNTLFEGLVDDIRIYDRPLSETEVQELYQQGINLQQGLVAHFPFDGNANDVAGVNYGTAHNGVSYTVGLIGQAANFDGIDDFITLPHSETILGANPSEWSYSAWFLANANPEKLSIISDYNSNIWDERYGINLVVHRTNQIRVECRYSLATEDPLFSNTVIQDETWNFVTVVVSKPQGKYMLFVNGVFDSEKTLANSEADYIENVPVHIGAVVYYGQKTSHFDGIIDDVRIYNRALSAAEIIELYNIDTDGDGIPNSDDNCPLVLNPDQADNDTDGQGDACDPDDDNDGVFDTSDNCPFIPNPDQEDNDMDLMGDACDDDDDNDDVSDTNDNCPFVANADQSDFDSDGLGDLCDFDPDGDDVVEGDNCPYTPNSLQEDTDNDGFGDVCDDDDDNDGIADVDDNCPLTVNANQDDLDSDSIGNTCDIDIDGDNIVNDTDNCPMTPNVGQDDTDFDGYGDSCDDDDDNDGVLDNDDNCSLMFNPDQSDMDADGQGDVCDGDLDGDGLSNEVDNCPTVANADQNDWDGNGLGDVCDNDIDGDGVLNDSDECDFTPVGEVIDPSTGCAIEELVPCDNPRGTTELWKNHGQYMSTLAKTANGFLKDGIITEEEKDAIMSEGANSDCGK